MKLLKSIVGILTLSLLSSNFANAGSHAYTYSGPDISGEKLTILGPWLAPEDESFRDVISIFENATGAVVEYGGSDEFEQIINIDCQAGSPADIAVFPQPGLAANIAATGCLNSLDDSIKQMVLDNYAAGQSWVDLSTYKDAAGFGTFYSHKTPKRIGRNPKTKDSYIIQPRIKINFKPSNKVRGTLN